MHLNIRMLLGLAIFINISTAETIHIPADADSIQRGIIMAGSGDTVLVQRGTYNENIDFLGKSIVVTSNFIFDNDTASISQTIIDGGGSATNQTVVSFLNAVDNNAKLIGFRITNGWASGSHGGGITLKNSANPSIENCWIMGNSGTSGSFGGLGIYCRNSSPVFYNCRIENNSISGNGNYNHRGGGLYVVENSGPEFSDCMFIDNKMAPSIFHRDWGGAAYISGSSVIFNDCIFNRNSADYGAGLFADNSATLTLNNCELSHNQARNNSGALHSQNSALIQIDSCLIHNNSAAGNGGAIYTGANGQATVTKTTITENKASLGAGIYAGDLNAVTLTDCIVFYNWHNEIYPSNLETVTYCDVRGGYNGEGNIDIDPLFCNWLINDYHLAVNSPCLTSGSSGGLIGYYGSACTAIYPVTRNVPAEYSTIQEAINASFQGDTILVARGTYKENLLLWGRRITVISNYNATKDTSDISQTIIDGGGSDKNQSAVSFTHSEDSLCLLRGFKITNGWASGNHGGGITLKNRSNPNIENCWIINNTGTSSHMTGIGIYCLGSSPSFRHCTIKNNSVSGNGNYDHRGGGLYAVGLSSPEFFNCNFVDNKMAPSMFHRDWGGAAYINNSSALFEDCHFSGNAADYGAGLFADNNATLTLRNCELSFNTARNNSGAFHSQGSAFIQIDSSLVHNNSAIGNGGGIYTGSEGRVTVSKSTFTENKASHGAAVYAGTANAVTLTDCIVFYNWTSEIFPSDLETITYCNVRGGYTGEGNFDTDPLFCNWQTNDYHLAANSLCLISGSSGGLIGYRGSGCAAIYPVIRTVPTEYPTIQEAINASYQGDTVLVTRGTYQENLHFWGRRITVTSSYNSTKDTSDISQTIIDGGGSEKNLSPVSFVHGEDSLTVFRGIRITNGWASGNHGGGMTVKYNSNPVIDHCWITDNTGTSSHMTGIGIYCLASSPVFRNCIIYNNSVEGNGNYDHRGGGLYAVGSAGPQFYDCVFLENKMAPSIFHRDWGGAAYINNSSAIFDGCQISGNTADYGGGIFADNNAFLVLRNCDLSLNFARNNSGALHSQNLSQVEIDSCLIHKNSAVQNGGAIYTGNDGQIMARKTTFTENSASHGAAVYAGTSNSVTLSDCIMFFNWSDEIYPSDLETVSYCNVRGGYIGEGNIDTDPLFCDWSANDYHLAANSPSLTSGNSGRLMGYLGSGCSAVYPLTRNVPSEHPTIQEAINASYQGDTVLVDRGIYQENLHLWGRRITLASNYCTSKDTADIAQTIIDGGGSATNHSVLSLIHGEDSLTVLAGLTITNGWASGIHGGGMTIRSNSNPVVEDCWIQDNSAAKEHCAGIGISCIESSPVFNRCRISNNSALDNGNYNHYGAGVYIAAGSEPIFNECHFDSNRIAYTIYHRNYGGAVYCNESNPEFSKCTFAYNSADFGGALEILNSSIVKLSNSIIQTNSGRNQGGGIYMNGSKLLLVNCTFYNNFSSGSGGGIYQHSSELDIHNSIFWADSAAANSDEIHVVGDSAVVNYTSIKSGWPGTGNIEAEPVFLDTIDFILADGSDCVDAGDPDPIYNDREDPLNPGFALFPAKGGLRNDMGAYGGPEVVDWIITGVDEVENEIEIPTGFSVLQNFPNPFNPSTQIHYSLPEPSVVKIEIFNLIGQKIHTLVNEALPAGRHKTVFSGQNLPSGVYFYRITAAAAISSRKFSQIKKMMLIK